MFSNDPPQKSYDPKLARRQDRKIIKLEAAYGADRQTFIVNRNYDLHVRDVIDEAAKTFKMPANQIILYWKGRNICATPDELLEKLGVENNNTMRICRADDQSQQNRQQQLRSQQGSNQQGATSNGAYGQQQGSSSGGLYGQQQGSASGGFYGQQGSSSGGGYGQQQGSSSGGGYGQQQGFSSGGSYGQQGFSSGGGYGQQGSSSGGMYGQQGSSSSSSNEMYTQQQSYQPQYQQQTYYTYPAGFDQQQYMNNTNTGSQPCNCSCHQEQQNTCKCGCNSPRSTNRYQQLTNQTVSNPVAATYIVNLQIGFADRVEGLAIGRQHPLTIYDLQVELQQHYGIPVLEQHISYNGMPLIQLPPDTSLDSIGIVNSSFITLWYKNYVYAYPQQSNGYYSPRQQGTSSYYEDATQSLPSSDTSSRRVNVSNSGGETMRNSGNQEVMKIEVFHGSDRHVLVLRSANQIRISDLMDELQTITNVPIQNQKLYYRGQELQIVKERTLRDAGLDNNAQVRLIGEPTKSRYVAMMT